MVRWGPEDALTWLKEVAMRKVELGKWLSKVEARNLLASPVNLCQLFRARTFLNALRQQTARQTGKAIDSLKLVGVWNTALLPASASVRVQVQGLKLQGCGFLKDQLTELQPDAPTLITIPPCTLCYMHQDEPDVYAGEASALAVPVYFSPTREDFVCEIRMPCRGNHEQWILSGVALLLTDVG